MRVKLSSNNLLQACIKNRHIYHYLFWITLFASMLFDLSDLLQTISTGKYFLLIFGRIILFIGLVYFHLLILRPIYWRTNKLLYWIYMLLSLLPFCTLTIGLNRLLSIPGSDSFTPATFSIYFFVGLRILFLSAILKLTVEWYDQDRYIQELHIRNLESEVKFLKSQLNPHFLFNTLNSLQSLIVTKSSKASEVVEHLADIMDYMLYQTNERFVPLQNEIKYIKNYLFLEKVRKGESAKITIQVAGECLAWQIAPLLMLPLVENGIKHGLNKMATGGSLDVKIEVMNGILAFVVENKVPTQRSVANKQGGMGISTLKRRLALLYKDNFILDTHQGKDTYVASLKLLLS